MQYGYFVDDTQRPGVVDTKAKEQRYKEMMLLTCVQQTTQTYHCYFFTFS